MVITGFDSKSIGIALDNVQAKLLMGILRLTTVPQLMEASNEVQNAGFAVFATDAEAARSSFVSVLGQYLNNMVHVSMTQGEPERTTRVKTDQEVIDSDKKEFLN